MLQQGTILCDSFNMACLIVNGKNRSGLII